MEFILVFASDRDGPFTSFTGCGAADPSMRRSVKEIDAEAPATVTEEPRFWSLASGNVNSASREGTGWWRPENKEYSPARCKPSVLTSVVVLESMALPKVRDWSSVQLFETADSGLQSVGRRPAGLLIFPRTAGF